MNNNIECDLILIFLTTVFTAGLGAYLMGFGGFLMGGVAGFVGSLLLVLWVGSNEAI